MKENGKTAAIIILILALIALEHLRDQWKKVALMHSKNASDAIQLLEKITPIPAPIPAPIGGQLKLEPKDIDTEIQRRAEVIYKEHDAARQDRWDRDLFTEAMRGNSTSYIRLEYYGNSTALKHEARKVWKWENDKPVFIGGKP